MAKRKDGMDRSTGLPEELAQERERNRLLEERIATLEANGIGEPSQVQPTSADGTSGELPEEQETTPGVWVNEKGHLCIGRECIMAEATPEGLRFRLDPESCDPKTRETFVNAMLKGIRIGLNE